MVFISSNTTQSTKDEDQNIDPSDTIHDSFYRFALQKNLESKEKNEKLFDKSINKCPYAPIKNETKVMIKTVKPLLKTVPLSPYSGTKLFLIDDLTVGLLSSTDMSISFYRINLSDLSMTLLVTNYFYNLIPFDACADKSKNVFVIFPGDNKLVKYYVKNKKTSISFKEVRSIVEPNFSPSAISCTFNLVYASQRANNIVRVYDKRLNLVDQIEMLGVVLSVHSSLSIDPFVKVFVDGLDAVGLFDMDTFGTGSFNTCHFYKNMMCIESVYVYSNVLEEPFSASIFVADSCDKDVKHFLFNRKERISLKQIFKFDLGSPVSTVRNSLNHLVALTNYPSHLSVVNLNDI